MWRSRGSRDQARYPFGVPFTPAVLLVVVAAEQAVERELTARSSKKLSGDRQPPRTSRALFEILSPGTDKLPRGRRRILCALNGRCSGPRSCRLESACRTARWSGGAESSLPPRRRTSARVVARRSGC
ncbi:unnamed protein product, partial [Ixodes persulcatus]